MLKIEKEEAVSVIEEKLLPITIVWNEGDKEPIRKMIAIESDEERKSAIKALPEHQFERIHALLHEVEKLIEICIAPEGKPDNVSQSDYDFIWSLVPIILEKQSKKLIK